MRKQQSLSTRCVVYIGRFVGATWVALGLSLLCLFIDAYAIFTLPHHSVREPNGTSLFMVALWTLEIVIGLLALWLLRFAFSRPRRVVLDT